jgi:hypothetical protein
MAGLATLALACGCGGGSGGTSSTPSSSTQAAPTAQPTVSSTTKAAPEHRAKPAHHQKPKPTPKPKPKPPAVPPGASAALHSYITALDAHDGAALCALFEPGALDALKLPVGRGCGGLSQSIGYDPGHGLPQWTQAQLAGVKDAVPEGGGVRATVTIVDHYAGNPQPSIEDDVVFLARSGGDWLIRQPSVTIYRAIGVPDPPPSVLAAPK